MHGQATENASYLTLTEAAKIAPGRPSTNCVWRWCRRGVLGRDGQKIRLQHLRIGGMIYTKASWLEEFGRALAEADAHYFDLQETAAAAACAAEPLRVRRRQRRHPSSQADERRSHERDEIDLELDAEGLR